MGEANTVMPGLELNGGANDLLLAELRTIVDQSVRHSTSRSDRWNVRLTILRNGQTPRIEFALRKAPIDNQNMEINKVKLALSVSVFMD